MKVRSLFLGLLASAALCLPGLLSFSSIARAADAAATDTNAQPAVAAPAAIISSPEVEELRTKLDALQRANDLALGRWGALLDQNNALSNVLANLQQSLENQRQREIQIDKETRAFNTRVMLGAGAAIFLVFLASYWFQLRCLNRVMEIARATPELPAPFAPALLEAANSRESKLLEAIKLLEDRIRHLETPAVAGPSVPANAAPVINLEPNPNPAPAPAQKPVINVPSNVIEAKKANGTSENGHGAHEIKAIESAPVAAEPQPETKVSVLLAKGEVLLEAERLQDAVNAFNEALSYEPGNAEAHLKKGIALERLNRLELALTSYNESLRLNPKRSFAYVYKARVLAALHRYDEALSVYDMALGKPAKSAPNGGPTEINRANAAG